MSDGDRACIIMDKLYDIINNLEITKRKKNQLKHWLEKLYYCLDV